MGKKSKGSDDRPQGKKSQQLMATELGTDGQSQGTSSQSPSGTPYSSEWSTHRQGSPPQTLPECSTPGARKRGEFTAHHDWHPPLPHPGSQPQNTPKSARKITRKQNNLSKQLRRPGKPRRVSEPPPNLEAVKRSVEGDSLLSERGPTCYVTHGHRAGEGGGAEVPRNSECLASCDRTQRFFGPATVRSPQTDTRQPSRPHAGPLKKVPADAPAFLPAPTRSGSPAGGPPPRGPENSCGTAPPPPERRRGGSASQVLARHGAGCAHAPSPRGCRHTFPGVKPGPGGGCPICSPAIGSLPPPDSLAPESRQPPEFRSPSPQPRNEIRGRAALGLRTRIALSVRLVGR
ncbi:proline-rich proteoglycan 2-like [Capricornis sumatraensis]|uniref:proline-rich proteoglycan 2-like n=1 Tax=Capricornis sumatraensis TaxID=34865 RepID=UPI003604D5BA